MPKIPANLSISLLDRMAFMNWQYGVAFNGMITLNFEQIGATDERAANRALTKLNEAVADRIHRHGKAYSPDVKLPHLFMYVHEHVESHGHHVHELVVLPRGLDADFDRWLKAWARRNYGPSVHPSAIHYKGRHYKDEATRADQQRRLACYILKSSEDACLWAREGGATTLHAVLGIDEPNRARCAKVSRITGSSQNIATRAQIEVGFSWPEWIEDAMTDIHLREYNRRIRADELHRQLRAIDI